MPNFTKGAPLENYWSTAIENSKLSEVITEEDRPALLALQDIRCEATTNNIQLWFDIRDNPSFGACVLRRELILDDGLPVESKGDLIDWKAGKCLTFETKTVANKKTGEKKQVLSDKKKASLFHFFANHNDQEEEGAEHLKIQAMIFNELVNEVVPYSLEYYMGVVENDDEFEGDIEGEIEGEDEDDEDEDDKPTKKRH